MPKYSTIPERYEGAEFPPIWPLDVLDASGCIVGQYIVYFDTDTGIVIERPKDEKGIPILWEYRQYSGHIERVSLHAAPLTFIPYVKSDDN
jgi:hypothetical protein